jgi:GPH family glycoside/pentoside/hexuronide:cation symporter
MLRANQRGLKSVTTNAIPPVRRLPAPTMLAYGSGAIAYGVKDLSFSTFLLLFYNPGDRTARG